VTDQKNKPRLDEETFAKLLEAAYVLQEHNREMRQMEESLESHSEQLRQLEAETQAALLRSTRRQEENPRPNPEYTLTLAEIVEAQHQIQIRHLESDKAMALVAERIVRITGSSGAGIGILEGKTIKYRAGAGSSALPAGSDTPLETAICAICVRTGQVLRTPDINTEFLFDPDLCRARDIQSLVAVPIYHDGNIVGALELYFDRLNGFAEQDIHTCQLMAGLVTEAIGRGSESALKKSMAEERSSMLAAIEKLKPNLSALADGEGDYRAPDNARNSSERSGASATEDFLCWTCGSKVIEAEQFCGKCGAPRVGEADPSIQSKLASALHMQATHEVSAPFNPASLVAVQPHDAPLNSAEVEIAVNKLLVHPPPAALSPARKKKDPPPGPASALNEVEGADRDLVSPDLQRETASTDLPSVTLVAPPDPTWSSAAKAREFLETISETRTPNGLVRFWRARRGDFYLAVAVILVLVVVRWGILSNHSVGANAGGSTVPTSAARRKAADADLSMFDKLLIDLGLAEAPETLTSEKGNPNTQVWIDLHTALYYCPGSDLYGQTPNGRFASQHDAQLDQFESASRKACD
jgi:putative methionine-R-sulfoxide reductase with GAF domain